MKYCKDFPPRKGDTITYWYNHDNRIGTILSYSDKEIVARRNWGPFGDIDKLKIEDVLFIKEKFSIISIFKNLFGKFFSKKKLGSSQTV